MLFSEKVKVELASSRKKFPPINTLHEGYAIILEEVDEFWDAVKKWPKQFNENDLLGELVQIAAMAQRVAEDCLEVKEIERES